MINGYATSLPVIKKIGFEPGRIEIRLVDGRIITTPLSSFPTIKRLSILQRKKYQVLDGIGIAFEGLDETFHISQFLGENNKVFDCKP